MMPTALVRPTVCDAGAQGSALHLTVYVLPFAIALSILASLASSQSLPTSRRAESAPVSFVVRGRVLDRAGRPIVDATVEPIWDPPDLFGWNRRPSPIVRTDREGLYAIPKLLDGSYRVVVRHPGFAGYLSTPFEVPKSGDVRLADVVLGPGGGITGCVRMPGGEPDAHAMVQVSLLDSRLNVPIRPTAWTDAHGRFEIPDLPPGEYRVVVCQRNGQPDLAELFQAMKKPRLVMVAAGEMKEIDL